MVSSLKNNKRNRKNALDILKENGEYSTKTEVHFKNNATKRQLRDIREKLILQNKKSTQKKVIILLLLLGLTIYFIGFAKF